MSGQPQQQQQQQKGQQNQKAPAEGISANATLAITDVTNADALANKAMVLGGAALLFSAFRFFAPLVKKHVFKLDTQAGPSINYATANDIKQHLVSKTKEDSKGWGWVMSSAFNELSEDQKQAAMKGMKLPGGGNNAKQNNQPADKPQS